MGKMTMAIVLVFAIEFSLFLFTGFAPAQQNPIFNLLTLPDQTAFSNSCSTGAIGLNVNCLLSGSNSFIYFIQAMFIACVLIAGITATTGFVFKQDIVLFAGVSLFFLSFFVSLIHLWVFMNSSLGNLGNASSIVATIICFPLMIVYLMTLLDYIRGRD